MATPINSYRDLLIWQESKSFAVEIYKVTDKFPKEEIYGLTSQLRRASVSIPSNIAEGFRRKSKNERMRFLRIAYGSGAEIETQLEISWELKYISEEEYKILIEKLDKMMRMTNRAIGAVDKS